MTNPTKSPAKNDLIEGYRAALDQLPREAMELSLGLTLRTVRALSRGRALSATDLVDVWEMPQEQVTAVLAMAAQSGQAEVDAAGDLVGGVLTLEPTGHEISFADATVYAWCALDAIWAPAVVGQTARVRSTDPVSGAAIDLTVSPAGVQDVRPAGAMVTVVGANTDTGGGRRSPRCAQMLFFESPTSAREWAKDRPGVAILTPAEAREVADASVIEPARRAGLL